MLSEVIKVISSGIIGRTKCTVLYILGITPLIDRQGDWGLVSGMNFWLYITLNGSISPEKSLLVVELPLPI